MELRGLEDLERASSDVLQALTAAETAEAGARLIAASARPLVPREAGTLAASETVNGGQLVYTAPYAPIVHAAQPWLGDAIAAVLPQLVEHYDATAAQAWQT
jgi:hypothetical protein